MSKKIYNNKQEKWKAARERNKEIREKKRKEVRNTFSGKLKDLLDKCNQRTRKKNLENNLDFEFLVDLWHQQNGKCAISKLNLQTEAGNRKTQGVNYFTVSVDRKDSSKGYTKDNVQLLCFGVNQIKSNFTDEEFKFWIRTISREAFNDN